MLVYGDHHELAEPGSRAREINRSLDVVERMPAGVERHARLVSALIEAGKLLQGIADAAFANEQRDGRREPIDELSGFLTEIGRAVCRSWDSGFAEIGVLPRLEPRDDWPSEIELRVPEGYAFYALYPEAYIEAARRLTLTGTPRVIGIRSIGTSLAAVVAATLGAPPPTTVRPFGDPYDRKIATSAESERELLDADAHYVIVDEGPGQSGSSFGAVVDWFQERGVPPERIALMPSHDGAPGPAGSAERRGWWRSVQRAVGDFAECWPTLIERWLAFDVGPLDQRPLDISGGAWRELQYATAGDWPAVVPAWERRKYLAHAAGERLLVKFAGLGRIGEEKLAIARALHVDGLVPEPIGLVHGFLVERWCEHAVPLPPGEKPLAEIAHYIATRAKLLPATRGSGATIDELLRMMKRNISLEFGGHAAQLLDHWEDRATELERRIVRVRTDNKLDRHEWLRAASGRLLKTDAVDHHQAHDLIGCQDIAWDVASAAVEFDLDQEEARALVGAIEQSAVRVDRELLDFCRPAYLAFRLGHARLGTSMTAENGERLRIERRGDRYAAELQHLLESTTAATRPLSSVG
jgi:hypothetical protein